jgi:hypothetical protein
MLDIKELPNTVFVQKRIDEREKVDAENRKLDSLLTYADSLKKHYNDSLTVNGLSSVENDTTGSITDPWMNKSPYGNEISINLNPNSEDSAKVKSNKKIKLKENDANIFQITGNTNDDGSFKTNKYKIKFSPDIIYSNATYSSFYGIQGIIQMAFSDVIGNHRIYAALSAVLI